MINVGCNAQVSMYGFCYSSALRGCRGKSCPSESAGTYDIAACGGDDSSL